MKGTEVANGQFDNVHSFAHFAGMTSNGYHLSKCSVVHNNCCGSWIVDTGASNYITYNQHFFTNLQPLKNAIYSPYLMVLSKLLLMLDKYHFALN